MKKLQGQSEEQLREISRQIADAFYDYTYNEADTDFFENKEENVAVPGYGEAF